MLSVSHLEKITRCAIRLVAGRKLRSSLVVAEMGWRWRRRYSWWFSYRYAAGADASKSWRTVCERVATVRSSRHVILDVIQPSTCMAVSDSLFFAATVVVGIVDAANSGISILS